MNTNETLRNKLIENLYLDGPIRPIRSLADMEEILFAYDIAYVAHLGQFRDGGSEYITHPVEGCVMMARDYGISDIALHVSFLLHDTGEDTLVFGNRKKQTWARFGEVLLARVGRVFGKEVARTVHLLTKPGIDSVQFKDKQEIMRYYLARLEEPGKVQEKATFGKMIDRLHNLRSLLPNNPAKTEKQILETENLLLPLFERVNERIMKRHPDEPRCDFEARFGAVIADIRAEVERLKAQTP